MGNCWGTKKSSYDDEYYYDSDEEEDGDVIVAPHRYTYAHHRRSRFDLHREKDDPASDNDENLRQIALGMTGGKAPKEKRKKRRTKFDQNNTMLQDLLDGKSTKKGGFFARKLAKFRAKSKKRKEEKEREKQEKREKKAQAKRERHERKERIRELEMQARQSKNVKSVKSKEATRQAMQEAMGEIPASPPAIVIEEEVDLEKEKRKSRDNKTLAGRVLMNQMSKYKERFGVEKSEPRGEYQFGEEGL